VKGPEPFLRALNIGVTCPVRKGRPAAVDSTMRVFVGHDVFYFSGAEEREFFRRDPLRYCRRLTDPITLKRFQPSRKSPHLEWKGRPYYFATEATRAAFAATPDSFAIRKGM
jgi:YHS domain-containing protein